MKPLFRKIFSLNPASITILLTLFIFVIFLIGIPILDLIELKTYDLRFLSRGEIKPSSEIALAVIDEKSLNTEGRWPWPRSKFAELIDTLSNEGAKVIAFDIVFSEPDENSNLGFLSQLDEKIDQLKIKEPRLKDFLNESKLKADNDLALANSIKRSKVKTILGYFFHMSQADLEYHVSSEDMDVQLKRISNSKYPLISYERQNLDIDPFITAYAPVGNLEILNTFASATGYFNMFPSEDGVVRGMPLIIRCGAESHTPLSIQTVWQYLDCPQLMIKVASYGIEGIQMGRKFIPTDENGQMLINYRGPTKMFPHYSIGDILRGNIPKGTFKDKIVLVGATAIGIYDLRNTPFTPIYPGVEIHATVIDNVLSGDFIHKPKWTKIYDVLAILFLGLITGVLVPRLSAIKGIIFSASLFAIHILVSNWFFSRFHLSVNIVYPLLCLSLIFVALTIYHYLVEEKNKRFLHATFASYLSPALIDEMVRSETMPELGGEARNITAYFTDIQGFSSFSENLTAHQLVELLNEYLSTMTDILIKEGGTLDKYEGDAIVSFFGAPMPIPDHALKACRVSVAMQNSLLDLRKKWMAEKLLPDEPSRNTKNLPSHQWAPGDKWPKVVHNMRMRIGINSGEMVVGNMGSSVRMNYTMMGDAVNLAARLEAGAKQFGIYTSVSEYTLNCEYMDGNGVRKRVWDEVEARFIDTITVVGKSEPVKIYELVALKGGLSEQEKELFRTFDRGLQYYLKMAWDAAITCFKESLRLERFPDMNVTPSSLFIARCEEYKLSPPVPPGQKWDGVYRMTKK